MVSFSRKHVVKLARRGLLAGIFLVMGLPDVPAIFAQGAAPQASSPLILRSTIENLVRGFIPAGMAPACAFSRVKPCRSKRSRTMGSLMTRWRFSRATGSQRRWFCRI